MAKTSYILIMYNIKYEVNLTTLKQNIKNIKAYCGCKFCAVVKGNAYGHNMVAISPKIESEVDYFGVATLSEALILRNTKISKPILIMGRCDNVLPCISNNIILTCVSMEHLKQIIDNAKGQSVNIHIKFNSGMNRLGIKNIKEFLSMLKLAKQNNIIVIGFYTHFATAFCDTEYMNFQLKNFKRAVKIIKKYCPDILIHAANTPACFVNKSTCFDMVRIGIGMYGYAELPMGFTKPVVITPVLKISAKLIQIYNIKAGERVGYGNIFIASKSMRIGVISMGYADGFKKANTGYYVAINEQYAQIIGGICMDMFMIDLNCINAKEGDYAFVLNLSQELNAMALAKHCNTAVSYILTEFNYKRADFVLTE